MTELDRLIWTRVWALAQAQGWSKAELAKRVGTPPQTLMRVWSMSYPESSSQEK